MAKAAPESSGYLASDWGRSAVQPRRRERLRPKVDALPEVEQQRAAALIDKAKQVLRAQFDALRNGEPVDLGGVRRVTTDVARSIARNRYAVIGLTRLRSSHEYTYVHSIAVSALMIGLARELNLSEAEVAAAGLAGMLHDIGKSKVPVQVLDKPGPLSPEEWATIKTHPERGATILERLGEADPIVIDVALHHHERLDGKGYPHGLEGDALSLYARMGAVCDVYDALTSRRAYKEPRPAAAVLETMAKAEGQFDQRILRALRSLIGAFPMGTLVRLQRGQLGVVVDTAPIDPLSPRVEILYSAETRRALAPEIVETQGNPIVAVERASDWPGLDLSRNS